MKNLLAAHQVGPLRRSFHTYLSPFTTVLAQFDPFLANQPPVQTVAATGSWRCCAGLSRFVPARLSKPRQTSGLFGLVVLATLSGRCRARNPQLVCVVTLIGLLPLGSQCRHAAEVATATAATVVPRQALIL